MQKCFLPAKLLLSFTNKDSGKVIVDASRRGGAGGGTRLRARALREDGATSAGYYETQDVVIILMWNEAAGVIDSVVEGVAGSSERVDGACVIIDVPGALAQPGASPAATQITKGDDTMKSGSMMIVSITNHGEAESLMNAARKAGARGGTIIDARGTGTEDDLKYFGVSLTPEKEILIIISDAAHAGIILEELGRQPLFSEPGGGIIFAVAVERFILLKNF